MFKSATQQDHGDIGVDGLQNKVRQLIEGKKYFLILDDLWNERREEWLKLREFLQVGAKGSRVVVTTRSKKVAGAIGDDPMHALEGLSDDDSWHLFRRVAFNQGSGEVDDDLADIGKDIVKKCANVPLAIRVVGSMLYGHDKSEWKLFQRIKLSEIMGRSTEESIMPILKFSYHQLKPQLKSCFSYCALFPKDYQIEKELLIRLWSAQGYLDNHMQSREDVGEEYFSILLQRCFLQDIKHDEYGEISSCKMHDLIHDLAQEVAGKESYFMEETSKRSDGKTRHLATSSLLLNPSDVLDKFRGLRTFLRPSYRKLDCESQVSTIIAKYRRLRVLDLNMVRIKALPRTIKNLLHLRYLDLSHNERLKTLPESITRLYNLQVLSLRFCFNLEELPKDMRELVNLRHLDIHGCDGLSHMPAGMDSMTGLCTLTREHIY
ncbi:putative disease resistance protein RGA3 [Chenopodium quinoa]|uniref:putative disease resistance protein RGA3 n=1 Tax=Chenopodium quinoa TaxID=63459 RepID=UPI000B76D319|nr:putative disease resistance protein RGA3 [Chenopodium quinoa]